jgi:hypothetical protein
MTIRQTVRDEALHCAPGISVSAAYGFTGDAHGLDPRADPPPRGGAGTESPAAAPKLPAGSTRHTSLLDEIADMLTEMRRTMLGGGNRSQ